MKKRNIYQSQSQELLETTIWPDVKICQNLIRRLIHALSITNQFFNIILSSGLSCRQSPLSISQPDP